MSTQSQAKRARRNAKVDYRNLAPLVRPHYHKMSASAAQRKLQLLIETERRIRQGSKKK